MLLVRDQPLFFIPGDALAEPLDRAVTPLGLTPASLGRRGDSGLVAALGLVSGLADQLEQSIHRIPAILFLCAELSGIQD